MYKKFISTLAITAFMVAGCAEKPQEKVEPATEVAQTAGYPVTVSFLDEDKNEVEQTITSEPQQVVVMGSAMAELMIAFDLQDKVKGVGYLDYTSSKYADAIKALPLLSDTWASKESILALQPDLIYSMSSGLKDDRVGDIPFWNERKVPVLSAANYTQVNMESYLADIENFGKVFNISEKTQAFIDEQQEVIAAIKEKAEAATVKPKVLLLASAGRENYDYYPPEWSLVDEMVEAAGGEYMKMTEEGYTELATEAILAAQPEKIILTEFQQPDAEKTKQALITNPKLANLAAVKNDEILVVDYTNAIRGSLDVADLFKAVAEFVQPSIFGNAK